MLSSNSANSPMLPPMPNAWSTTSPSRSAAQSTVPSLLVDSPVTTTGLLTVAPCSGDDTRMPGATDGSAWIGPSSRTWR